MCALGGNGLDALPSLWRVVGSGTLFQFACRQLAVIQLSLAACVLWTTVALLWTTVDVYLFNVSVQDVRSTTLTPSASCLQRGEMMLPVPSCTGGEREVQSSTGRRGPRYNSRLQACSRSGHLAVSNTHEKRLSDQRRSKRGARGAQNL